MAKKKDPSITYLNKFGYNVVKLPRVGIEPMDVIGKDDTTQWLGPLRSVWRSSSAEPKPGNPQPTTQISGQKTDKLDVGFGLKVLANALSAFGASTPSLDFAYKSAKNVTFAYTNVTSTSVPPFDAGNYLANGALNTDSPVVTHYFQSPDAQAYLIVDVLKSDSITVTATDEHGVEISVDVPVIQQLVGANVSLKPSGSSNGAITYSGKVPVTFGFLVNEIEFDGAKWSIHGVSADSGLAFGVAAGAGGQSPAAGASGLNLGAGAASASAGPQPVLLSTGCLVALNG